MTMDKRLHGPHAGSSRSWQSGETHMSADKGFMLLLKLVHIAEDPLHNLDGISHVGAMGLFECLYIGVACERRCERAWRCLIGVS